jgi:shikimate kinase
VSAIVLVGVPGAGKSTVGRALAQRLGEPFTDIDELVEQKAGKAISQIFIDDGEPAFRELEAGTIAEVLSGARGVVALGGGALGNERRSWRATQSCGSRPTSRRPSSVSVSTRTARCCWAMCAASWPI